MQDFLLNYSDTVVSSPVFFKNTKLAYVQFAGHQIDEHAMSFVDMPYNSVFNEIGLIPFIGYYWLCKQTNKLYFLYLKDNALYFQGIDSSGKKATINVSSAFVAIYIDKTASKRVVNIWVDGENLFHDVYSINWKDRFFLDTDAFENPDFFEWLSYKLVSNKDKEDLRGFLNKNSLTLNLSSP